MTEAGIVACAPVHDSVLIEASAEKISDVVRTAQAMMKRASEVVLSGVSLRTEAKIVQYPDRYTEKRGENMWNTVMNILGDIVHDKPAS